MSEKAEKNNLVLDMAREISGPVILLIAATVCIQLHAYEYWEATMGNGLLYSLTIEGVAIAFWIYSKLTPSIPIYAIAITSSLLSFSAPALNNLSPVIEKYKVTSQKIDVWEEQKNRLMNDAATLKENWNTNLENSKTRIGWRDATDEARESYEKKSNELDFHLINKPSVLDILMNNINILTILISVAVLQFASVFLSRFIGDGVRKSLVVNDKSKLEVVEKQAIHVDKGLHLAYSNNEEMQGDISGSIDITSYISKKIIAKREKDPSFTCAKIAGMTDAHARDISLLINHEEKARLKKTDKKVRVISEAKAISIAQGCGIDISFYENAGAASSN